MKTTIRNCPDLSASLKNALCEGSWDSASDRQKAHYAKVNQLWSEAPSFDAFAASVFADASLRGSRAYAALSLSDRCKSGHSNRLRQIFGDHLFTTCADAGSVLVAGKDNGLTIAIPCEGGDGNISCAVFRTGEECNRDMMRYTGIWLCGDMVILDYDCPDCPIHRPAPVQEIHGCFFVYTYGSFVAFIEEEKK